MNLIEKQNQIKEGIKKSNTTIEQVEKKTIDALDQTLVAFHNTRFVKIIPSMISACCDYAEIETPSNARDVSWLVKRSTKKSLDNVVDVWIKYFGFERAKVVSAVKSACESWVHQILEENELL